MEDSPERRPKRQKRETSYKAKAFEKFKQLKSGSRNKYEVEEIENVYETVAEKDYVKEVLSRQDDDWIVDDDGSGYVEDGRDIFDDDLDSESITKEMSKGKGVKRKKKAVSENAGKGNLQQMLSSMPTKKKEEKKLEEDDMLSEILDEISSAPTTSSKKTQSLSEIKLNKQVAKDYMKTFSAPPPITLTKRKSLNKPSSSTSTKYVKVELTPSTSAEKNNGTSKEEELESLIESEPYSTQSESISIEVDDSQDVSCFDDDLDITLIEQFESQETSKEIPKLADDIQAEFLSEWESLASQVDENGTTNENIPTDVPLEEINGKKVFRFFWWDAYEDTEKRRGCVLLFGKTYCEKTKSFVSCCVTVKDIPRKLFVLPRPFMLDEQGNETETPVTFKELYMEFNTRYMKPLNISGFKTRYVYKKYAFDPSVPFESDYMEVQYPAKDPPIYVATDSKYRTFSKIFGLKTSYLEILLLERKIKGPCWLDIECPVEVTNPISWCKLEVDCLKISNIRVSQLEKPLPPPPLVVTAINLRCAANPRTSLNEIVMISCLTQTKYALDKQAPQPPFQQHFCVFSGPPMQPLPLDIHDSLKTYKATRVQKIDSEKALINFFLTQFANIDPDLIVGHDLQGYQINVLAESINRHQNKNFGKFGRIKRSNPAKLERSLFVGRLVCDIKISAKELIKSRSYDLDALCQAVLKLKDGQRIDLEPDDVPKMFSSSQDILKLISFTMQDTAYILKIMYDLNVIPLSLQITNIAGNVMSRTLLGGRSERNEFLLLHAFTEKDYIVPDKQTKKFEPDEKKRSTASKKKPTYAGGLVLEPKTGFYDKLILLMDFNSLYPSIIQEYNICFTTMPPGVDEDNMVLPDKNLQPGILPTEIRKLVESRREVKKLMNNQDISNDLRMQYHIRQMALKLTANSMYGCLGFSNSRFFAKNLAALVTHKGREILTNTRDLVQKLSLDVVYGDTDSIMINTNSLDYEQVMKTGARIKQEVNRLYKQVELDIDGVFKYLLLLKKKKYAAVTLTKTKTGELKAEKEYKGLDIVRRDWSQLAAEAGKYILEHILSDQSPDERINNIHTYLAKVREDLQENRVPIQLLIITKQLTKDPRMYTDSSSLPHVQVALRYNKQSGGHFRSGDTVPYVICDDGSGKAATQRAYHIDEFKNSDALKIDVQYYLSQQIHPVVSRICEPIEGTDNYQIATHLGLDLSQYKVSKPRNKDPLENVTKPEIKFRNVEKFTFKCLGCYKENHVDSLLVGNVPFLEKCGNPDCDVRPIDYIGAIQNQVVVQIRSFIQKYYKGILICEDPACPNETRRLPLRFVGKFPVCRMCSKGVMYKQYTEHDLYMQLSYFLHIFDVSKLGKKPIMEQQVEAGYHSLVETVEKYLKHSGYSVINLTELFSGFLIRNKCPEQKVMDGFKLLECPEDEEDF